MVHFLTTANGKWDAPAATHLTVYIEPVNGKLRLAAQDIQNTDLPHGLTQGVQPGQRGAWHWGGPTDGSILTPVRLAGSSRTTSMPQRPSPLNALLAT